MINDGTVKWEVRKITEAENSNLLNDKTAMQIINEVLVKIPDSSKVYISGGTIGHGGTIPLPSGYVREQCKYSVWFSGFSFDNYETNTIGWELSVNQLNGVVNCRYCESKWRNSTAGYLCIAVK